MSVVNYIGPFAMENRVIGCDQDGHHGDHLNGEVS